MGKKGCILRLALLVAAYSMFVSLVAQNGYTIKHFNTENGLPLNSINAMAIGHNGHLWMGTHNGLIRYNGLHFHTLLLDTVQKNSPSNNVIALYEYPKDSLVLAISNNEKIFILRNGLAEEYRENIKPRTALQQRASDLIKKNLLTGNPHQQTVYGNGYFRKHPNEAAVLEYCQNGKLYKTFRFADSIRSYRVTENYLFLIDEAYNIYLFNKASFAFQKLSKDWTAAERALPRSQQLKFFHDYYSGKTFCTDNSTVYLLQFDAARKSVAFIPQFTTGNQDYLYINIKYDSASSTFFLSTFNAGLFQVRLKRITTINLNQNFPSNVNAYKVLNYSIVATSDSTAAIPSGLQLTSHASGKISIKKLGTLFGERQTIAMDPSTRYTYISNRGQLIYFSPADNFITPHPITVSHKQTGHEVSHVGTMILPEADSIWVADVSSLYYIKGAALKRTGITCVIGRSDMSFRTARFYRIDSVSAFVGNYTGLYRMTTRYPFAIDTFHNMQGKEIRDINRYKDVYFISVYKDGLYVLSKNIFYKVPFDKDFSELSVCHSAYVDDKGYLWLPTDKGLLLSTAESVVASVLKQRTPPFFYRFGVSDGIDNTEFNGSGFPAYTVMKDSRIMYPSMGGIVSFIPSELRAIFSKSSLRIEEVWTDETQLVLQGDSLNIDSDIKVVELKLNTAYFGESKNLKIEYNIDNQGWKKVHPEDMKIVLIALSSGCHTVTIRKRTGFGESDFVVRTLVICKEKKSHEYFWFYPAILCLAGILIGVLATLRTRSINRKRKELQELVDQQTSELSKTVEVRDLLIGIISHDMITPLRHIGFVADVLGKGLEKNTEKIAEALFDIKTSSDRILTGSMSIVNWMKYHNKKMLVDIHELHLYSIINETLEIFRPIAQKKGLDIYNAVPRHAIVEADYNILSTVLNNLVSNAVKYTRKGSIKILIDEPASGDATILKITDTGPGIDEEMLHVLRKIISGNLDILKTTSKVTTGLGYVLMSELTQMHGFSLEIESDKHTGGTTISLIMPDTVSSQPK